MVRAAALILLLQTAQPWERDWSRWLHLGVDRNGSTWAYDSQTISLDATPVVWVRMDHSSDSSTEYRRTLMQLEIDCTSRRVRTLAMTRYRPDGTSRRGYTSLLYEPIIPDTMVEELTMFLCVISSDPAAE